MKWISGRLKNAFYQALTTLTSHLTAIWHSMEGHYVYEATGLSPNAIGICSGLFTLLRRIKHRQQKKMSSFEEEFVFSPIPAIRIY